VDGDARRHGVSDTAEVTLAHRGHDRKWLPKRTPDGVAGTDVMIDTHAIAAVAGIFTIGVVSPGPNFMVVARRAVAHGRAEALAAVLGVVAVSAVWAGSSLFGVGIVFKLFPWTRLLLKILGAAYLLWAGTRLWKHAGAPLPTAPVEVGARHSLWRAFRSGLATNLSNAKSIAFYTSAFAAVAPSPDKTETLWASLAVVLVISASWYGLVAVALSTGAIARAYRRAKGVIERACGVLMMLFALRLATE
jgi:threonine/homoserine/homoserine lactone efflux protein